MGWKVSWQVKCERCGVLGPLDHCSKVAERKAVAEGWRKGRVQGMAMHCCPVCAVLATPTHWPDATGFVIEWEEQA